MSQSLRQHSGQIQASTPTAPETGGSRHNYVTALQALPEQGTAQAPSDQGRTYATKTLTFAG
jgi:hypothetical protein